MIRKKIIVRFFTIFSVFVFSAQIQSGDGGKSFLWEIKHKKNISYLLGSIHASKAEMYPLKRTIESAFFKSDILVLEADISKYKEPEMMAKIMKAGLYGENDALEKNVSKKTYNIIRDILKKKYGTDIALYEKFKPWFLALTIQGMEFLKMGLFPKYGVDNHFFNKASGKKTILELEGSDYHIALLNSFSKEEQEFFLLYSLKELDHLKEVVDRIITTWENGDTEELEKLLTENVKESPEFKSIYKKMLVDRNISMAKKIVSYLKNDKRYFIVVGAAHLVGEKGIIHLLKKKGFELKQL